jgi:sensor histidine kinase regulating citrate/malate metabolism
VSCYLIFFFAFRPFTRNTNENFDDRVKAAFSIVVLLLTQIMARMTQGNVDRNRMSVIAESLYQILCDIFVLLLQFGVMQHAALNQNVDAMRELVHHQHEQFRQSKDSVDLVNEKYHDLKGLLQNYKGQISAAEMERLQETIGQYDTFVRTGNHVLDIVLAEKRAICNQRGIELTSFMDGSRLLFLEELDLYSLVGNALNNAIDAVSVLPEEERYIILKSNIKGNMVTIHTENPFSGDIKMENALPQSQRDARYHGFGVKSMERTAEKYGGTISVKAEDHMFFLDIILFSKEEG